jgi:thiosulfate reductase cytochrome b subunit
VHGTFVPQELQLNSLHFTLLHLNSKQNHSHKSRQFTPHHYTSHHLTYLHSIPTCIPLLLTTALTLFLNVFILQKKDASKPAGNWFQLLIFLHLLVFKSCLFLDDDDYVKIWCLTSSNFEQLCRFTNQRKS